MTTKPKTAIERIAYAHGIDFARTQFYDEIVALDFGTFRLPSGKVIPVVREVEIKSQKNLFDFLGY